MSVGVSIDQHGYFGMSVTALGFVRVIHGISFVGLMPLTGPDRALGFKQFYVAL